MKDKDAYERPIVGVLRSRRRGVRSASDLGGGSCGGWFRGVLTVAQLRIVIAGRAAVHVSSLAARHLKGFVSSQVRLSGACANKPMT